MITQITSQETDWNGYIIDEDGRAVIIDCGNGEETAAVIREKGWTVDYIFLSHEHFDHIKGLEMVRHEFDAPVVACELCSERIQSVVSNLSNIADVLAYFKTGEIPEGTSERFTCGAADIVYPEEFRLSWEGHEFDFQRIPGHSPGSVLITMDGRDVFTGDYLIYGEEEILRLKDGSPEDYEQFARPVLEKIPEGSMIYPGHGRIYQKGRENTNGSGSVSE